MKCLIFLFIVLFTLNAEAISVSKEAQFEPPNQDLQIQKIVDAFQGRITFLDTSQTASDGRHSENLDGIFEVISDTGSADVEFSITHGLDRVPVGFIVMKSSKSGGTYDSGTTWTATIIYLKNSSANNAITIWIF